MNTKRGGPWLIMALMIMALMVLVSIRARDTRQRVHPERDVSSTQLEPEPPPDISPFMPLPIYLRADYEPDIQGLTATEALAVKVLLTCTGDIHIHHDPFLLLSGPQQAEVLRLAKAENREIVSHRQGHCGPLKETSDVMQASPSRLDVVPVDPVPAGTRYCGRTSE